MARKKNSKKARVLKKKCRELESMLAERVFALRKLLRTERNANKKLSKKYGLLYAKNEELRNRVLELEKVVEEKEIEINRLIRMYELEVENQGLKEMLRNLRQENFELVSQQVEVEEQEVEVNRKSKSISRKKPSSGKIKSKNKLSGKELESAREGFLRSIGMGVGGCGENDEILGESISGEDSSSEDVITEQEERQKKKEKKRREVPRNSKRRVVYMSDYQKGHKKKKKPNLKKITGKLSRKEKKRLQNGG